MNGPRIQWGSALLMTLVAVLLPLSGSAQAQEGPTVSFTGRMHAQWATSSAENAVDSEFFIRRARVTAQIAVNDLVSGKVQPEFAGGGVTLRDAYADLDFSPYFSVRMGQFKRPFDLFELESSTQNLVIERTGRIDGAGDCAGVGSICSYSRFTEKLEYADRDIGVQIGGALGNGPLSYAVAMTNGEGLGEDEINADKSYTARLEFEALDDLVISANVGMHDYENEVDPTEDYGTAWGVDVDWGAFDPGFHFQWAFVGGDNWMDLTEAGTPTTFRTSQAVVSYRFEVMDTPNLSGIEPVFRLSWADPNTELENDVEYFATGGVIFHFLGRNRLAANIEMWDPTFADREWSMKVQTYLHF